MTHIAVASFQGALACVLLATLPAWALTDKPEKPDTREGKVVGVKETRLIMTDQNGEERIQALDSFTKVTIDGRPAKPQDLKAGMPIRVTTKRDTSRTALRV